VLGDVLDHGLPSKSYPLLPRERMVAAALGLTRRQAARAYSRARMHFEAGQRPPRFDWEGAVLEEKGRTLGRDDVVEFVDVHEGLDAVGGAEDLKTWLETRTAAFTAEARAFGLPVPRGLLLVGVQGCGKSLVAKAVARHWGLPLLRLDLGSVFGGVLPPDAALRRSLMVAETLAPSVLWTDEIEKGFTADADGTTQRVLGTLLTWLQEKESEVFFVATANDVAHLSPELLRKGRFDELFFVDLPDARARAQIFAIHLRKRKRSPGDFDLQALSTATAHFSGAELEQVVVAGLYEAFADGRELRTDDMMAVIEETVPLYATHEEAINGLREWGRHRARFAARDQMLVDFFE
jgi:SpoVK/Ycf46/Vps4 family AAA+-type ATPase